MVCNEYFLVILGSNPTPVRHKYTNLTDEWYGPDGVRYEDQDTISEIEDQATDANKLGDSTIYQKLLDLYAQGSDINTNISELGTSIEEIKVDIGDIKTVLDHINGEVV